MKVLIVDDSKLSATSLSRSVMRVVPDSDCQIALSGTEALEICDRDVIDVVFLDIEMPGINGLDLAERLKVQFPETNVVFVTGYTEYALDAWGTQASAFLVKPASEDDIRRALDQLRSPIARPYDTGLFVRCFGNFEVFYNRSPVHFERQQTKELLAYLVDRRNALVSMGELMAVLWEDMPDTASRRSQLRTLISDLRRTMESLGYPNVVVKRRGGIAVNLKYRECDYYAYMRGIPGAVNSYKGEYMRQYSWAEPTAALLGT